MSVLEAAAMKIVMMGSGGVGGGVFGDVGAVPGDVAGIGALEAGEEAEERGFAAAVGAEEQEGAARGDLEGEVAQDEALGAETGQIDGGDAHVTGTVKDLKKRGLKFVGSTIAYAYLQAVGVVDDHVTVCTRKPTHPVTKKRRRAR